MDTARIEGTAVVNITESTLVYRYFAAVRQVVLHMRDATEGSVDLYMKGKRKDSRELSETITLYGEEDNTDIELVFHSTSPVCLECIEVIGDTAHEHL